MQSTMILLAGLVWAAPDAPANQELSVERAARQFRINVYDTYRNDRPTYDRLRATGDELLSKWEDAGHPIRHHDEVVGWYQNAWTDESAVSMALPDLPLPVFPEPDAAVNADRFSAAESDALSRRRPLAAWPIESGEVLFEGPQSADELHDLSPVSPATEPSAEDASSPDDDAPESPSVFKSLGRSVLNAVGF